MKSLTEIYAMNDQDPRLAFKPGKFVRSKSTGCLIYTPPEFLDAPTEEEKEKKD